MMTTLDKAVLTFLVIGVLVSMGFGSCGCAAAKPVCQGIDLANQACKFFVVTMPDGTKVPVPRERLEAAGRAELGQ